MKTWHRKGIALRCAALLALLGPSSVVAAPTPKNKRDHLNVYPAADVATKGALTVDGELGDWKPDVFVEMFADPDLRDTYSLRIALAYDREGLLIGARFADKSPLVNHIDPAVDPFTGWSGDALQIRFVSDPALSDPTLTGKLSPSQERSDRIVHLTAWYYTDARLPVLDVRYGMDFRAPRTLTGAASGLIYKNAPGGYALEGRLPWSLFKGDPPRPGTRWRLTLQPLWGDAQGKHVHDFYEVIRAAGFQFQRPDGWGYAHFVAPAEFASKLAEQRRDEARRAGPVSPTVPGGFTVPVRYDNPKQGFVSLAICRPDGQIVRTLLTKAARPKGPQTERWDGRDDAGVPAPAGRYVLKALVHDGIKPRFVTSVMQSGDPPWGNSGKYGWGADHGVPVGAAADPAGNTYLMWTHNEGGDYLIQVDARGRKRWGVDLSWGDFSGDATAVCYDNGLVYTAKDGLDNSKPDRPGRGGLFVHDAKTGRRVTFPGGRGILPVTEWPRSLLPAGKKDGGRLLHHANLLAMAASPERLFCALNLENKIVAFDKKTFQIAATYAVPRPAGLAYDANRESLYAVSGDRVVRIEPSRGGRVSPVVAGGLDAPCGLALDAAGNLYVGTGGRQMQVRVFSPDGKLLRAIGKEGGRPAVGTFDPGGMFRPAGLCVDTRGQLWVTESDTSPERVSLWEAATGRLRQQFWGTAAYAPMMAPDLERPEHVYLHNTRFLVDYDKGTFAPDAMLYRQSHAGGIRIPGSEQGFGFMGNTFQVATIGDRKFAYNGHGGVFAYGAERFDPLLYLGQGFSGIPRLPKPDATPWNFSFAWSDTNKNGLVDEAEVRRVESVRLHNNIAQFGGTFWPGGIFIKGRRIFKPAGLSSDGVPLYPEPEQAPPVVQGDGPMAKYSNWLDVWPSLQSDWKEFYAIASLPAPGGNPNGGGGDAIVRFDRSGDIKWRYSRVAVHFGLKAPLAKTGDLFGALRIAGEVQQPAARGGEILAIGCYRGYYGFLNEDGLFIDQIGYDNGRGPAPNFDVFYIENFSGYFFRHPRTGKVYLFCGDVDARILELQGWESLQRFDAGELTVTASQHTQVAATASTDGARGEAPVLAVAAATPDIAGDPSGWGAARPASIALDETTNAQVRLAHDAQNLYALFEVPDDSPWRNSAADWRFLFKGGDAVDIQLGAGIPGPLRVMIAPDETGKGCRAVAMWKALPPGMSAEPMLYKSPTGQESFERVALLPQVRCSVRKSAKGYSVAAAIPWSALGLAAPGSGGAAALRGDAGVLLSDTSGALTIRRRYRFNQDTAIVNDIPSEVRLRSDTWGALLLGTPGGTSAP